MKHDLVMAAINKLLDAKQDVAGLLSQYPALAEQVDGQIADAVDTLISASRNNHDSGTPWPHLPHLTVSVDRETNDQLMKLANETAAKFPSR